MGQVKSMLMDQMEDTRVYLEINWFETEIDVDLIQYDKDLNKYGGYGIVTEGPNIGEEIFLSDKICRIALAKYEEEKQW
jgi:hypothetical protein